jgi:hypothetical protein
MQTTIQNTGASRYYKLAIANYRNVGDADLVVIDTSGNSGHIEIFTLSASSQYRQEALARRQIPILNPPNPTYWVFLMTDYDNDGIPDLVAINRSGDSGYVEIQILSGVSGYEQAILPNRRTAIPNPTITTSWEFSMRDFLSDFSRRPDLVSVNKNGPSGMPEIRILSGQSGYGQDAYPNRGMSLPDTKGYFIFPNTNYLKGPPPRHIRGTAARSTRPNYYIASSWNPCMCGCAASLTIPLANASVPPSRSSATYQKYRVRFSTE